MFLGHILESVVGSPNTVPLEQRVLNVVVIALTIVTTTMVGLSLTVVGSPPYTIPFVSAVTLVLLGIYFGSRYRRASHEFLVWLLCLIAVSAIWLDWFFFSGPFGSTIPGAVILGVLLPVITLSHRHKRWVILLTSAGVLSLAVFIATTNRAILEPTSSLIIERGINTAFGFLVGLALIGQVILAYRRQQHKLESLNQELRIANSSLHRSNLDLKAAAEEIQTLRGIIPICANCKKIRNSEGYYQSVDEYLSNHSEVTFSHGICKDCARELYPDFVDDE